MRPMAVPRLVRVKTPTEATPAPVALWYEAGEPRLPEAEGQLRVEQGQEVDRDKPRTRTGKKSRRRKRKMSFLPPS